MKKPLNIAIAGTGNAARTLINKDLGPDFSVSHVWGRNMERISRLDLNSNIRVITDPGSFDDSDILILAVSDKAIKEVSESFMSYTGLVVHLSGTSAVDDIQQTRRAAVWPIQSLGGELTDVPVIYEAAESDLPLVLSFIRSLGGIAREGDLETRRKYHLAAVFCNNFTNFVTACAQGLLDDPEDIRLFLPMMRKSLKNLETVPARDLQTGPAVRGDDKTINEHLKLLDNHPIEKELYIELTRLIRAYYK